jgi:hypothetical protein
MRQWRVVLLAALLAGCSGNPGTSGSQTDKSPSTPRAGGSEKKPSEEAKLVSKALAEPAILTFVQEDLKGKDAKIESVSEPMEPEKKKTELYGPTATAYYVTYSVFSETTKKRESYADIMWVTLRNGKGLVMGHQLAFFYANEADKEWLAKHPIPK